MAKTPVLLRVSVHDYGGIRCSVRCLSFHPCNADYLRTRPTGGRKSGCDHAIDRISVSRTSYTFVDCDFDDNRNGPFNALVRDWLDQTTICLFFRHHIAIRFRNTRSRIRFAGRQETSKDTNADSYIESRYNRRLFYSSGKKCTCDQLQIAI